MVCAYLQSGRQGVTRPSNVSVHCRETLSLPSPGKHSAVAAVVLGREHSAGRSDREQCCHGRSARRPTAADPDWNVPSLLDKYHHQHHHMTRKSTTKNRPYSGSVLMTCTHEDDCLDVMIRDVC